MKLQRKWLNLGNTFSTGNLSRVDLGFLLQYQGYNLVAYGHDQSNSVFSNNIGVFTPITIEDLVGNQNLLDIGVKGYKQILMQLIFN